MRRFNKRNSGAGGSSSSRADNQATGAGGSGSSQADNQDLGVGGYIPTFTNPGYDQIWGSQFPQMSPQQLMQQQQLLNSYAALHASPQAQVNAQGHVQAQAQAQAQAQNWLFNSYAAFQSSQQPPPRSPQFTTPSPFQSPSPRTPSSFGSPDYVPETQDDYYQQQEEEEEDDDDVNDDDDDDDDDETGDKRGGKAKRKNWTELEEKMLAEAWCGVSENARYGNDQNMKQFWKHVTKRFNDAIGKGPKYRSMDQCNTKFNNMNREVQKYNGAYTNLRNQPRSGENEIDLRQRAASMYYSDTCKKWKYGHVWNVVKDNGKWKQLPLMDEIAKRGRRRSRLSTQHLPTSQADPYNVEDDENSFIPESRSLPIGRDRSKKKAKTSSSSSTRSEEFSDLKNQFSNLNANISERNELRAMEVYLQDISYLQGEAYDAALAMKAKLKAKYKW